MSRAGGPNSIGELSIGTKIDLGGIDADLDALKQKLGSADGATDLSTGKWLAYGTAILTTATAFYELGKAIGDTIFQITKLDQAQENNAARNLELMQRGYSLMSKGLEDRAKGTQFEGQAATRIAELSRLDAATAGLKEDVASYRDSGLWLVADRLAQFVTPINTLNAAMGTDVTLSDAANYRKIQKIDANEERMAQLRTELGQLSDSLNQRNTVRGLAAAAGVAGAETLPLTPLSGEQRMAVALGGDRVVEYLAEMSRKLTELNERMQNLQIQNTPTPERKY